MSVRLCAFLLLFAAFPSFAQKKPVKTPAPKAISGLFAVAFDLRFERDEDQQVKARNILNLAGGLVAGSWVPVFEYGKFEQSTSAGGITVDRRVESMMAWVYYQDPESDTFAPFIGGGAGAWHESVDTDLLGVSEHDEAPASLTLAGAFGMRVMPKSRFWLSSEARLYKNAKLDPDPMLGLLVRLGIVF